MSLKIHQYVSDVVKSPEYLRLFLTEIVDASKVGDYIKNCLYNRLDKTFETKLDWLVEENNDIPQLLNDISNTIKMILGHIPETSDTDVQVSYIKNKFNAAGKYYVIISLNYTTTEHNRLKVTHPNFINFIKRDFRIVMDSKMFRIRYHQILSPDSLTAFLNKFYNSIGDDSNSNLVCESYDLIANHFDATYDERRRDKNNITQRFRKIIINTLERLLPINEWDVSTVYYYPNTYTSFDVFSVYFSFTISAKDYNLMKLRDIDKADFIRKEFDIHEDLE